MKNLLGLADHGHQRKGGFDGHAVIPSAFLTQFDIGRHAIRTAKTPLRHKNSLSVPCTQEVQEILIWTVHGIPYPATNLPKTVEYPTQFDPDTPASLIFALAPDLLLGAAFADGENQLDGITIDHIQDVRLR